MNDPAVIQTHRAFSLTCVVEANILANATVIWRLLTDADGFSRWNSTVSRIEGQIREGERSGCTFPGRTVHLPPSSRMWYRTSV